MPNFDDIGAPISASAEISFDSKYTTAFMVLRPPQNGGAHINMNVVVEALRSSGVAYGLINENIKKAVEGKWYNKSVIIANWKPPVDGENGSVEYFFERNKIAAPVEDENGIVDYKNLGFITNIYKGTKIAKVTRPTEGEPGTDVLGRPVPQKKGTAAKITLGKGTAYKNNNTEIVASVDGNLRYSIGGFTVDEDLVLMGDVDISKGNINFIGNVTVKGNVFEGFRVISKKNITIEGSVTGAEISAGGNVTIKLGCVGANINCSGNVSLDFCENSTIHSEGRVEATSFVGSEVYAAKSIVAIRKSVIAGGKYTALESIEASTIGAESYVRTEITLGDNAVMAEEREQHSDRVVELNDKIERLTKVIDMLVDMKKRGKLTEMREQQMQEAIDLRKQMSDEQKQRSRRMEEIDFALERKQDLSVGCKKQFYPGVSIRINDCVYTVNEVCHYARAKVVDGVIVMEQY